MSIPGVPGGAERAVGGVLVEEVALLCDNVVAEVVEEAAGDVKVAGQVKGMGDKRTVARPDVAIGVTVDSCSFNHNRQ